MKTPEKDYYKILGVNKSSDADTIKKAYRKLAMKHHPDKNQGDKESEDKFKEIGEAYDILSNPDKKHMYDMGERYSSFSGNPFDIFNSVFGQSWGGIRFSTQRQPINPDNKVIFRATLAQIITGGNVFVEFTRYIACDACLGKGHINGNGLCSTCNGSGQLNSNLANMMFVTGCPNCMGTGKEKIKCQKCDGKAYQTRNEKAEVEIPKGIAPLSTLKIKNKGNEIYVGGSKVVGHTYLMIDYPRSENGVLLDMGNIYLMVRVPFNTVMAEEKIQIDVLGCREIELKIDSVRESGYQYTIKGSGVTQDKDAFVKVFIDSPMNKLSEEQRKKLNDVLGEVYGKPLQRFKTTGN